MRRYGFLLACLAALAGLEAAAQEIGEGLLNAVAYKPLARDASIAVQPLDNSDANMVLKEIFENELKARGYAVSDDAPLVLTFETRDTIGVWSGYGQRTVIELSNNPDRVGSETPMVRLHLYDSSRGGMLTEGQRPGGDTRMTPSQYRLDASIDSRSDGKRLWQAWTIADLGQRDGLSLSKAMIPVVVESVGQTVKRQPFVLP